MYVGYKTHKIHKTACRVFVKMVKTCTASAAMSPLALRPKKRWTLLESTTPLTASTHEGKSFKEVLHRLVVQCFAAGQRGWWYCVLPKGELGDNVTCVLS